MRSPTLLNSLIAFLFFLFSFNAFSHGALAQEEKTSDVKDRQTTIQFITTALESNELDFINARDQLRLLRSEARQAIERLTRERDELQKQLTDLGPAPENGEIEPTDIAERRASLLMQSIETSAMLAQSKLNADDTNRILAGLSEKQRDAFFDETFKPAMSALRPTLWIKALSSASHILDKSEQHLNNWYLAKTKTKTLRTDVLKLFGVFAFAILLFWPVRRWINTIFAASLGKRHPTEFQKNIFMAARILSRLIPGIVGGFAILTVMNATGIISANGKAAALALWHVVLLCLAADGMALGLFAPRFSEWRIIPLTDDSARRARLLSVAAVSIIGLSYVLCTLAFIDAASRDFAHGVIVIEAILIIIILSIVALSSSWHLKDEDTLNVVITKRWSALRKLCLPLIAAIIIALLLGYLNLATFLSSRAVLFVGLIVWIWIGRRAFMSSLQLFDTTFMKSNKATESSGQKAMMFWAGLVVDFIILLTAIPMIALLLGVDAYSVRTGFIDAFTGITIGNFTLSLADIFAAIATFFIIILITRFLQRTLDVRLFTSSRADEGLRNSFRTLLGYAGLIIAILATISIVGLDLSNLAIIAGALSVGIGFGLQSIVNNFVSGLILLFERPVKVGDWVVTSSGEGIIKKISVRSTEIITFDRASVIVPNSELISNSVINWTHKDKGGRVIVPVGVAYGTNMRQAREILLKVLADNNQILKNPAPFIYFKEFGESSLDLELRFHIRNITDNPIIRNDVRFAILDAFQDNDIEIPFPQRDIHIKQD